jgi:hypothetical protein
MVPCGYRFTAVGLITARTVPRLNLALRIPFRSPQQAAIGSCQLDAAGSSVSPRSVQAAVADGLVPVDGQPAPKFALAPEALLALG